MQRTDESTPSPAQPATVINPKVVVTRREPSYEPREPRPDRFDDRNRDRPRDQDRERPRSPERERDRDRPAFGERHSLRQDPRDRYAMDRRDPRQDGRSAGSVSHPERLERPARDGYRADPRPMDRPVRPQPSAPSRQSPVASAVPPEGVRLSKVMTERGLASRREADEWIDAGWVRVNGEMAVLGQRVTPDVRIEIDPAARQQQAQRVTVLLNKPIGYVSGQAEDGYEPASVLVTPANRWADDPARKTFHLGHARHLAPAGRLDIDSTGLLVLTQDGRIAKHLIGDDSDVEKEYLVRVQYLRDGDFPPESLRLLNHGLELDGHRLRPAKVSWANEDQLRFVLREGRKRQIRRMCEMVGLKVLALKRVRIGSVVLGKLPPGQWRYLREDERF
ncbi:RNA pseudouridylate synthase [Vitreoscilla filiformis]|uniref:Dual-specificity RNA pseudouridine synthase RluF n=2 Tax=Vitreoscilla filiformis TaxID=63 RepID=A0A221KGI4_VITFI|nr:RNA pseudouridylate synthase [Vitreoscilla filiformis]